MALGAVVALQQVEQAGHVGAQLLHQALLDGAHRGVVALQQAAHQFGVIAVGQGSAQSHHPGDKTVRIGIFNLSRAAQGHGWHRVITQNRDF